VLFWSAAAHTTETDALYVVVPGGARGAARAGALIELAPSIVTVDDRAKGMGDSLAAGIRALPAATEAVVVGLGDQPLIPSGVVRLLCERWRGGGARAVAPLDGHPVLFDRDTFTALAALDGDRGARLLLEWLGSELALVPVDEGAPRDVDTPAALRALAATLPGRRRPPSAR
jgi:CTP:molybdopterin cytidylyltransferase MocA